MCFNVVFIKCIELRYWGILITSTILCCSFFTDFGPLNIASLYRYCCKLNKKLKVSASTVLMNFNDMVEVKEVEDRTFV